MRILHSPWLKDDLHLGVESLFRHDFFFFAPRRQHTLDRNSCSNAIPGFCLPLKLHLGHLAAVGFLRYRGLIQSKASIQETAT